MQLTPRQKHALESICETFLPAADGWPSAVEIGVPDALSEAMDFNRRTRGRTQLLNLLDAWDSKLHAFFSIGEYECFSALPQEEREKILRSWADSSLRKRRAAFQALRKGIGFLYVMLREESGASRVWGKLKYPGPLGAQRPQARRALDVITPEKEMALTCDVCVIGSGAGGGVAAAVLAAAGKDVVVKAHPDVEVVGKGDGLLPGPIGQHRIGRCERGQVSLLFALARAVRNHRQQ